MKITIPKSELEKFLELASYVDVTTENIIYSPITEYILIQINKGFAKMTLTSQNSYIQYTFSIQSSETQTLLISYIELKHFFTDKRGEQITLTQTDNKIKISDGKSHSYHIIKSGIEINLYPTQPNISGVKSLRIEKKLIDRLVVSRKYILDEKKDKLLPIFNLASIKSNLLLSSDKQISCLFTLDSEFEFTIFSIKEINLISNFDFFDYIKTDNWNIIKYKTIVFGSKIREDISPGLIHEKILEYTQILDKKKYLKLNVEQLFGFCKYIKNKAKDPNVNSYLEVKKDGIELSYQDRANSIEEYKTLDGTAIGFSDGEKICFVQGNVSKVLDSLNEDWINLSWCIESNGVRNYFGFWLESDPSFHSICSKGFEVESEIDRVQSANQE